jgi:hypothetical protein
MSAVAVVLQVFRSTGFEGRGPPGIRTPPPPRLPTSRGARHRLRGHAWPGWPRACSNRALHLTA